MWETFAEKNHAFVPPPSACLLTRSHQHCCCCSCCCGWCAGVHAGEATCAVGHMLWVCIREVEAQWVSGGHMLSSFTASTTAHLALPPGHNNRVSETRPQAPPINAAGSTLAPKTRAHADLKSGDRWGDFNGFWFSGVGAHQREVMLMSRPHSVVDILTIPVFAPHPPTSSSPPHPLLKL